MLKGNLLIAYKNVTEFKQRKEPLEIDYLEGYEAVGDGAKLIRLVSASLMFLFTLSVTPNGLLKIALKKCSCHRKLACHWWLTNFSISLTHQ